VFGLWHCNAFSIQVRGHFSHTHDDHSPYPKTFIRQSYSFICRPSLSTFRQCPFPHRTVLLFPGPDSLSGMKLTHTISEVCWCSCLLFRTVSVFGARRSSLLTQIIPFSGYLFGVHHFGVHTSCVRLGFRQFFGLFRLIYTFSVRFLRSLGKPTFHCLAEVGFHLVSMNRERPSSFSALELNSDSRRRADNEQSSVVPAFPFVLPSGEYSGVEVVNPVVDLIPFRSQTDVITPLISFGCLS